LKLDFEMAFDLFEHSLVLHMLATKSIPPKRIKWVEDWLCSATTVVLLNGTAGNDFKFKRGVKQGDLFPLFSLQLLLIFFSM
jgi:hypothetical protein